MSRIPGAEEWPDAVVRARIEFLIACASGARELSAIMRRRRGEAEPPRRTVPRLFETQTEIAGVAECWSDAAALAFCVDDTAGGLNYLTHAAEAGDLRSAGPAALTGPLNFPASLDLARAALREMEEKWEVHLTLMRRDTYHWS